MASHEELTEAAKSIIARHGTNHSLELDAGSFGGCTTLDKREMHVSYDPAFKLDDKRYGFRKSVTEPVMRTVEDIVAHECRHLPNDVTQGCPESIETHEERFYEPCAAILAKKGKETLTDTMTNLVEDLIDNTMGRNDPHAGLVTFYHQVAQWSPAFEAYMRIQTACWADNEDKEIMRKHFTNDKKIIKATQKFLATLQHEGRAMTQDQINTYFANKTNWTKITEDFTKAIEPLLKQPSDIPQQTIHTDINEKMKDPFQRRGFARKRYDKGQGPPSYMDHTERLDHLYTSLAKELKVQCDTPRKAKKLPAIPYQHTPYDPQSDNTRQIDWRKPLIIPQKDTPFGIDALTFGVARQHIDLPVQVKKSITNFPDFKIAYLDSSSSMQEGLEGDAGSTNYVPWGDKSKYHYLCKTWYGIIEYLSRQHILPQINVSLGSFSNTTHVGHGLKQAKETLLNPHFGNTHMDKDALEGMLKGKKSVFFTVSDGDVQNWHDTKDAFIKNAKQHHYFHIQLGNPTTMTQDLANAGLDVYTVNTNKEFEELAIDLTKKAYDKHIQNTLRRLQ